MCGHAVSLGAYLTALPCYLGGRRHGEMVAWNLGFSVSQVSERSIENQRKLLEDQCRALKIFQP